MKNFLFPLITAVFLSLSCQARAMNINGFVTIESSGYIFIDSSTQKRFDLKPASQSAAQDLKKLSNFDSITGQATLTTLGDSQVMLLESVDFVGLRQLLGLWKSRETVLNFIDYNEMSFYFSLVPNFKFQVPVIPGKGPRKANYRYSIAPTTTDCWRVFFADDDSVVLGTLKITNQKAIIVIYDADTGNTSATYTLEKVNP